MSFRAAASSRGGCASRSRRHLPRADRSAAPWLRALPHVVESAGDPYAWRPLAGEVEGATDRVAGLDRDLDHIERASELSARIDDVRGRRAPPVGRRIDSVLRG